MARQIEVTIEIILHATEDSKKTFDQIFKLFQIKEDEFSQETILGYFGNPILLARTILTKKRAEEFVKNLISKVPKSQIDEILRNVHMYFEDSSIFLRISKNDLVNGVVTLQQNNAIKIRIKVPIYKKNEIEKAYMELLRL